MTILAAILAAALTRAEIIERMRAAPIVKASGLVQVVADCPSDMRREFQSPIARFAGDLCVRLYRGTRIKEEDRSSPAIVIQIGDVRTNRSDVIVREQKWMDGAAYTRITVPAPAFADLEKMRLEIARAFMRHVKGREADAAEIEEILLAADPEIGALAKYRALERWLAGGKVEGDDEFFLKQLRSVLWPGVALPEDVTRFASRLYFYPAHYAAPFAGGLECCSFRDAIGLYKHDLSIRLAAFLMIQRVVAYGGGRGAALSEASVAYAEFLRELAAGKKSEEELHALLSAAETKLQLAMEEAQKRAQGVIK